MARGGIRKVRKWLLPQLPVGTTLEHKRSGHLCVTMPNRDRVYMSCTPSDYHAMLNARADFRRLGYPIKGRP